MEMKFPSPHSGILFLCEKELADYSAGIRNFRPLIRGFFFYLISAAAFMFNGNDFRPLIRGFFFYLMVL